MQHMLHDGNQLLKLREAKALKAKKNLAFINDKLAEFYGSFAPKTDKEVQIVKNLELSKNRIEADLNQSNSLFNQERIRFQNEFERVKKILSGLPQRAEQVLEALSVLSGIVAEIQRISTEEYKRKQEKLEKSPILKEIESSFANDIILKTKKIDEEIIEVEKFMKLQQILLEEKKKKKEELRIQHFKMKIEIDKMEEELKSQEIEEKARFEELKQKAAHEIAIEELKSQTFEELDENEEFINNLMQEIGMKPDSKDKNGRKNQSTSESNNKKPEKTFLTSTKSDEKATPESPDIEKDLQNLRNFSPKETEKKEANKIIPPYLIEKPIVEPKKKSSFSTTEQLIVIDSEDEEEEEEQEK